MGKRTERPQSWKRKYVLYRNKRWALPFARLELGCEWVSYWSSKWALLEVLEYVGKLGLIGALAVWLWNIPARRQAGEDAKKTKHYVAWQTINSAAGKPGNGGRGDALQDLARDGISMDGISLTGGTVLVGPLKITNAQMTHADLSGCVFSDVNFSRSTLFGSRWNNVTSEYCDFHGTFFMFVHFTNSVFRLCDFSITPLEGRQQNGCLVGTVFDAGPESDPSDVFECSFCNTDLSNTRWGKVIFNSCNFAHADLSEINFDETNTAFVYCNLYEASNASPKFVAWAYHRPLTFTNITIHEKWLSWLKESHPLFQAGGPNFFHWASNQWVNFTHTNSETWEDWKNTNLR